MTASLHDENGHKKSTPQGSLAPEQPIPQFVPNPSYRKFLAPGPTYIAPSSSFFFSSGQNPASLIDFLPSKPIADRLLSQYWLAVHPLCRTVHRPSFLRRYSAFWADVEAGIEPPASVQAVVFAALFSGVVSMPDKDVLMQFGTTKKDLVDNFQMGTETALGRANVIRTTKVETLQALVMYMVGPLHQISITLPQLPLYSHSGVRKAQSQLVQYHFSWCNRACYRLLKTCDLLCPAD